MGTLKSHQFAALINSRMSLMAEIATRVQRQQEEEQALKDALQKAVPQKLQRFIAQQDIIEYLVLGGRYSDRYNYNIRGLQSYESVASALEELRTAWQDNVVITIDEPGERGCVSIRYFVAPQIY